MQVVLQTECPNFLNVDKYLTVGELKNMASSLLGLNLNGLTFVYRGVVLEDSKSLEDVEIENLSVIEVHGSLARAGKVKNQTKKVEKQEKKKPKTGRCKRRILYNKRFKNQVTVRGRKVGPNSNRR